MDRSTLERYRAFARDDLPGAERLTLVAKLVCGMEGLLAREPDPEQQKLTAFEVMTLLQFAAADFAKGLAPLRDAFPGGLEKAPGPRWPLRWALEATMLGLIPQARTGDELVLVPLPAKVAHELLDALRALDAGEIPEMLAPAATERRGMVYTWEKARARALQHVAFLVGQGIPKGAARKRVSLATGIKRDTLRDWERQVDSRWEIAEEAGRVEAIERDGGARPSPMDAHVDHLLSELRREPLAVFGAYYQEKFGQRHWG